MTGFLTGSVVAVAIGLGAEQIFRRVAGSNRGDSERTGFFLLGTFGLVAGFLFGFGAVLRWGGGSLSAANGIWIAAAGVAMSLGGQMAVFWRSSN